MLTNRWAQTSLDLKPFSHQPWTTALEILSPMTALFFIPQLPPGEKLWQFKHQSDAHSERCSADNSVTHNLTFQLLCFLTESFTLSSRMSHSAVTFSISAAFISLSDTHLPPVGRRMLSLFSWISAVVIFHTDTNWGFDWFCISCNFICFIFHWKWRIGFLLSYFIWHFSRLQQHSCVKPPAI